MGITFNVYGDSRGQEKIFPFDLVPRLVTSEEWDWVEKGLKQRIRALNLFIHDIYNEQRIVRDGVVPAEIVHSAEGFRKECLGLDPPPRRLVPRHRGRTWFATGTARSTCWRTIFGFLPASPTCCRTGPS